jgi:two-component system heavy metal sensor histidine kinase CusS
VLPTKLTIGGPPFYSIVVAQMGEIWSSNPSFIKGQRELTEETKRGCRCSQRGVPSITACLAQGVTCILASLFLMTSSSTSSTALEIAKNAAADERARLLSVGAGIRLIGALAFLVVSCLFWFFSGQISWKGQILVFFAYTLLAAIIFASRRRKWMMRIALFPAVLDLIAPYVTSRYMIASHPEVGQLVAGITLGVFVIIVTLFGLSLRRRNIVFATIVALIEETLLLQQAGVAFWHMLVADCVLVLAARVGVIVIDRSERLLFESAGVKAARNQLEDTRAQFEQLSRLQRDKDSLVQLIVHDMRGPLSAAIMSLEFLTRELKRVGATTDMLEASEDALSASTNVASMITQILDTTKLEEGRITLHLEPVFAREMLDLACRQALSRAQSKSITIELDVPDTLLLVADKRLFPRLLDNLLSNAIRYTSSGGRILMVATESGGEIVLSVHNTGQNIPPEERERIFAKFQQGDLGPRPVFLPSGCGGP